MIWLAAFVLWASFPAAVVLWCRRYGWKAPTL